MFAPSSPLPIHKNPLMKGILSGIPEANYQAKEDVSLATMQNAPRAFNDPLFGHTISHVIFRRHPNGLLDYDYAVDKVVTALNEFKLKVVPLDEESKLALSCLFPTMFSFVDPGMISSLMTTSLRITPMECEEVVARVGEFLFERETYRLSSHT